MIGNVPKVATGLWRKFLFDRKRKSAGLPPHPSARQMQRTPINVNLSAARTFVCDSVPLQHFSAVAKALGVTINDVFSSCAAGALRRLLVDLDYDPDTHPLIGATRSRANGPWVCRVWVTTQPWTTAGCAATSPTRAHGCKPAARRTRR
ncbi:wax ester synthase-like Acyl-CoA acyltransferase domain protein [Mycobacterium ulcerans str. Harvey]|uniref:Wax ester synthase-like Acyl-CoA acyltransferase domain protein n=1 Tax=Mycobacterium ulcerans str. Harvey TaxID=1299332 RepID=A0ABN0QUN6_MYCUL|nr:wax ester synthase-like Acyl-CoA acyltransferase domain protein [Mycobacterium ulcerans str. Harvey]